MSFVLFLATVFEQHLHKNQYPNQNDQKVIDVVGLSLYLDFQQYIQY